MEETLKALEALQEEIRINGELADKALFAFGLALEDEDTD